MSESVGILVCYQFGTWPVLRACLSAVARHTTFPHFLWVAYKRPQAVESEVGLRELVRREGARRVRFESVAIDLPDLPSSKIHGRILDAVIPDVAAEHDYVLTMDSDCFPMRDGWLSDLAAMQKSGVATSGILHPWAPVDDAPSNSTARRVASQHCWDVTHVACQLVRSSLLLDCEAKFNDGDDTGLAVTTEMRASGLRCEGFKPLMCPLPADDTGYDPEFNRYVCVVYGDEKGPAVCHLGGYTRESVHGDRPILSREYDHARERVIEEGGPAWIAEDGNHHRYRFDREGEVFAEKMDRLFGLRNPVPWRALPPDPGYVPGKKKIGC